MAQNANSNTVPTSNDVSKWTTDDVVNWARTNAADFVDKLREQDVSGEALITLTVPDLTQQPYNLKGGPAKILVTRIQQLLPTTAQSVPPGSSGPADAPGAGQSHLQLPPVDPSVGTLIKEHVHNRQPFNFDNMEDEKMAKIEELYVSFEYSMVEGVLLDLGGLDIPHIQYPRNLFQPKTQFLKKDLPTMVSTEKLDLRMMAYDVYSETPTTETEIVQATLNEISACDKLLYAHAHVFLAGHAFGKTKSLFDIARNRYTILLDFSAQHHIDIQEMMGKFSEKCRGEFTSVMEDACVYELYITLVARIIVLHLALAKKGNLTPEYWRDLQLDGLVSSHCSTLKTVRNYLRQHFVKLDALQQLTHNIAAFHFMKLQQRLVVTADEANILISKFPKIFPRPSNTSITDRPLWSLVGSRLSEILSVAIIAAGTRIHLRDASVFTSSLAKYGAAAGQQVYVRTNFRATTSEQAMLLCNRLFTEHVDLETRNLFAKRLCVRSRYITGLAEFLDDYLHKFVSRSPSDALAEYCQKLISGDDPASIHSQLVELQKQHMSKEAFINDVCVLVRAYLLENGKLRLPEPGAVDWMAGGICYIEPGCTEVAYVITEGIIIEAIQIFLAKFDCSLAAYLTRELVSNSTLDPTSIGVMFDAIVATSITEQSALQKRPSFLREIPWAEGRNFSYSSALSHMDLQSYLDSRGKDKMLLPQNAVGFDLACLAVPIMVVNGHKISLDHLSAQEYNADIAAGKMEGTVKKIHHTVDSREVDYNYKKTLPLSLYTKKGDSLDSPLARREDYDTRKLEVLKWYSSHLKGIIRVHIVFPGAPVQSKDQGKHNFQPGKIRLTKRHFTINNANDKSTFNFTLDEAVVDIDCTCIEMCDMFPPNVISTLKRLRAPAQEKSQQLSSWDVEQLEEDFFHDETLFAKPKAVVSKAEMSRICDRCAAVYDAKSSLRLPYLKTEGRVMVMKYYCSLCENHKVIQNKEQPQPLLEWDDEKKRMWQIFATFQKAQILSNDLHQVQVFFNDNYSKILAGEQDAYQQFANTFKVPTDYTNTTKKRKK